MCLTVAANANGQAVFDTSIDTGIPAQQLYEHFGHEKIFLSGHFDTMYVFALSDGLLSKDVIGRWLPVYTLVDQHLVATDSLQFPPEVKDDMLKGAVMTNDKFVVLTADHLIVYRKTRSGLAHQLTIKTPYYYHRLTQLNDTTLVVSVTYGYHKLTQAQSSVISLFSLNTLSFGKTIFPDIHGIVYSFFTPVWVNACTDKIAVVTDPMNYTIDILNSNLEATTHIKPICQGWTAIKEDTLAAIARYEGKEALYVAKKYDEGISRILSVYFLDTTHLLVLYKLKGVDADRYYDIIQLENGHYTVISNKTLIKGDYDDEQSLMKNCSLPIVCIGNTSTTVIPFPGRQFAFPVVDYTPAGGNMSVQDFFMSQEQVRHNKNKNLWLLKFRW